MPRYYRRRYTRVVRPKKKWASNMVNVEYDSQTAGPGGSVVTLSTKAAFVFALCSNSAQGDSPTPVILKVGNFKTQLDCSVTAAPAVDSGFIKSTAYILYVPEGVWLAGTTTPEQEFDFFSSIIARHPEWIIAWKLIGGDWSNQAESADKVSFSSRLKRNLNSGDKVVLVFFSESNNNLQYAKIHSVTQFWTCAN